MSAIQQLLTEHLDIWTAADAGPKSGRGRSSANAASVYGIRKLRELIYEIAATGGLIPHDNSAKEYLLGDVAEFVMGQAPPGNECNTQGEGVVFVKTGEFGPIFPEIKEWTTKPLKFAKDGDVLICVVGATIGKLNLAINCAIGRSVAAIRPSAIIDTKYLYFSLMPFTIRLRENSRGSAQGVIGRAELSSVKIRIPSLNEQKQVIAKVDELMVLCDQLEAEHNNATEAHDKLVSHLLGTLTQSQSAEDFSANWQRIATHFDVLFTTEASIDALKQALLQLAVMGKLVPQDPNDEPASELLKCMHNEKAKLIVEGKIKKDKPLPPITDEEKSFEIPVSWEWVRLSVVANVLSGNAFRSEDFNNESGAKVIKITNAGVHELIESDDYLPLSFLSDFKSYLVNKDDLILALTRPYISTGLKISKCPVSYNDSLLNQRVAAIRASRKVNNDYIFLFFKSPSVLKLYQDRFGGSGLQPNLKITDVTDLLIAIPPLAEQHRIVAKVDELMTLCDQLKSHLTEASKLQQKLADVLVGNAVSVNGAKH